MYRYWRIVLYLLPTLQYSTWLVHHDLGEDDVLEGLAGLGALHAAVLLICLKYQQFFN